MAGAQSLLRHKQEVTSSLSCGSLPANQPLYSPPVYSSWFTFFRKQFWQIGKIATCLEIFSDFFFIHSKSRNDDTPSSLICAALPANYPRPLPPVYPLWFSFKPFCPCLFEQYPGGAYNSPLNILGLGGVQFFLEMTCSGMMYHFQKDS